VKKPKNIKVPKEINVDHFRVTIFGSARIKPGDQRYKQIFNLAKLIASEDMDVITGGGPGIMEAANKGHQEGRKNNNVHSFGLNINLPMEQHENKHLDVMKEFNLFSNRLDYFMFLSNVVVVAPGGIGTLLELSYAWQLMQVHHMKGIPIILVGKMWEELINWFEKYPLKSKLVSPEDMHNIFLADTTQQAMKVIRKAKEAFDNDDHELFCSNYTQYRI